MRLFRQSSYLSATFACVVLLVSAGCASLTDAPPPSSVVDPAVVQSRDGALSVYRGVISQFADVFASKNADAYGFALATGVFTDEYTCVDAGSGNCPGGPPATLDLRRAPIDEALMYGNLQTVRVSADQAIGLLTTYGSAEPKSLIGQMYAIKGYVAVLFGEFFCSGIPFGQVTYGGDIAYGVPRSTQQMFEDAVALFDSALVYTADSARIRQLAMVGKGRALLDLGRYDDAKAAVSDVSSDFRYDVKYSSDFPNYLHLDAFYFGVGNHEGTNGLNFASSNDSRMALSGGIPEQFAAVDAPVPLATGIEARLIEAEAKLADHDAPGWTAALDALRQTAIVPAIAPISADSSVSASPDAQVNMMFRERAFWLFGTGHRQGDLRRLIRQYRRPVTAVYPMGTHAVIPGPLNVYSTIVVVDPSGESPYNPNYKGCLNHDA